MSWLTSLSPQLWASTFSDTFLPHTPSLSRFCLLPFSSHPGALQTLSLLIPVLYVVVFGIIALRITAEFQPWAWDQQPGSAESPLCHWDWEHWRCSRPQTSSGMCGEQRTARGAQFFPLGTWVLELKLRSLGLVASAFTQWAIRKSLFSPFPVVPGIELSREDAWIKLKNI